MGKSSHIGCVLFDRRRPTKRFGRTKQAGRGKALAVLAGFARPCVVGHDAQRALFRSLGSFHGFIGALQYASVTLNRGVGARLALVVVVFLAGRHPSILGAWNQRSKGTSREDYPQQARVGPDAGSCAALGLIGTSLTAGIESLSSR